MTALQSYPAYKDSGVEWLGEVPEHWETRRLRNVLTGVTKRNRPDLPLLSVVREKGVILRDISDSTVNHNYIPDDLSSYKLVRSGWFAINKMKAWQGSFGVSAYDGIVSPAYHIYTVAGVESDFFHVAIRSRAYVPYFSAASDGVRIGQWDLSATRMRDIPFVVPSKPEQIRIARFLDDADRRIRRYIWTKERLIELLEEEKRATIHQAVTGRIDVRTGQPYPAYKDSGVEWLGEVPEHWEVMRARYVFREVDRRSRHGLEQHLSMSQELGLVPSHLVKNRTLVSESYAGGKLCDIDDLVLNRLKAHLGVFAVARHQGIVSPDYTVLRLKRAGAMEFFERVLRSSGCRSELRIRAKGIVEGFWRLYTDDFNEIKIPVPPVEEQIAIAGFLAAAGRRMSDRRAAFEREIALLREYRTRLIADVVTGKLDVREAAVELLDSRSDFLPGVIDS